MSDIFSRIGKGGPQYKRKDANDDPIAGECLAAGILLIDTHNLAFFVDRLAVGYSRRHDCVMLAMVEIKTSTGDLSPTQYELKHELQSRYGREVPYIVARSAEDILEWYGAI